MTSSEIRKLWIVHDIDAETVSIHGYKGKEQNLVLPEKIGTKDVVAIGYRAFRPDSHKAQKSVYQNIKSITLPNSIVKIEPEAFAGCKALVSIGFSENLEYLGYAAFSDCISLEKIEIPESLKSVDNNAFAGCKSLKQCVLQSEKTTITNGAFSNCVRLEEIVVRNGGTQKPFIWKDPTGGFLPNMGHYVFSGCKNLKEMSIHDDTKEIGQGFLYGCESVKTIELPEGLEYIGENAFRGCSAVKYLRIPSSVKKIDFWAFWGMRSLERVDVCSKNTVIDETTFNECPDFELRFI